MDIGTEGSENDQAIPNPECTSVGLCPKPQFLFCFDAKKEPKKIKADDALAGSIQIPCDCALPIYVPVNLADRRFYFFGSDWNTLANQLASCFGNQQVVF